MSTETVLWGLEVVLNILFLFFGAVVTYVSYLSIKGKLKSNALVGARMNLSRNYKLYQQDKYWYPLNRYSGEKTIYVGVIWTLLSLAIAILPVDPGLKMNLLSALILLVVIWLVFIAWRIYRYADRLVSADPAYR